MRTSASLPKVSFQPFQGAYFLSLIKSMNFPDFGRGQNPVIMYDSNRG